jgi:hypothetical protein
MVEHLPSHQEALSSNPTPPPFQKKLDRKSQDLLVNPNFITDHFWNYGQVTCFQREGTARLLGRPRKQHALHRLGTPLIRAICLVLLPAFLPTLPITCFPWVNVQQGRWDKGR